MQCVVGLIACGGGKDGKGGVSKKAEQENCKTVAQAMKEMEASLKRKEGGYHGPQIKTAKHWLPKIEEPTLTDPRSVELRKIYVETIKIYISAKESLEKGKGSRAGAHKLVEMRMNNTRASLHGHCPNSKPAAPAKTGNLAGTWKLDGPKTAAAWKASDRAKGRTEKQVKFFVDSFTKATGSLVLHKDGTVEYKRKDVTKGTWSQSGKKLEFEIRESATSNADKFTCKADGNELTCHNQGSPSVYTR